MLARVALKAAAGTAVRRLLVRRRVVREDPWLSHQALRVLLEQGSGKPLRKRVTTVATRFHPHDLNAFSLPYLRTNDPQRGKRGQARPGADLGADPGADFIFEMRGIVRRLIYGRISAVLVYSLV